MDFNQGLDARLVTDDVARMLARVKWIKRIRFGCDTPAQIAECERAISLLDKYGYRGEYFLYCILMDFEESFRRINHWKGKSKRIIPHAQPYRDLNNPHQVIPQWQKDLARWTDRKELYKSIEFKDFEPRKGFTCKQYFKKPIMTKEEQIRHLAIRTNLLYVLADITETHLMELERDIRRRTGHGMRFDAKRDYNAAIRAARRLLTDVNTCSRKTQEQFGDDADIIHALLLLIIDRTGDDDRLAYQLYRHIKAMPSKTHLETDIDEASVFGEEIVKQPDNFGTPG